MKEQRNNDRWWQAFSAALTGLTMAGAARIGAEADRREEATSSEETALARVDDDEDDDPIDTRDADAEHRRALVQEAVEIADTAWLSIVGETEGRDIGGAVAPPRRHDVGAIGKTVIHKTR